MPSIPSRQRPRNPPPMARRPFGTPREHGRPGLGACRGRWPPDGACATSLQAPLRHDAEQLRGMQEQVSPHLRDRPVRMARAYPHPERPRHHHRRHHVQVAPPREGVLVVAVVAPAVVRLDVPVRPHDLRELLRAPRVGAERRDVPGDLLRRLADLLADVAAALVLLPRPPRLPHLAVRSDDCPRAGEPRVHRVYGAVHLRLADFQATPVQLFFFKAPTRGRMRDSSPHCFRSPFWFFFTWST